MHEKYLAFKIPEGLRFADLKLARDSDTLDISFDWQPVEHICEASGIDPSLLRDAPEDNISSLIVAWYAQHREAGGPKDPIAEQIIKEVRREDAAPYN
jgi:hypothetical protein